MRVWLQGGGEYATNREPLGNQVDLPTNMVDLAEQFQALGWTMLGLVPVLQNFYSCKKLCTPTW